ncbi:leucine-rich PPR motif-containing protein, mitochondrial [Colletes gigas]|uniref:leucine-rich PPR motif-containing protein, mitochondrial n=1 Tax=Colletes gigas TaxID=935657 RepID=UPI001C9B4BF9|nr:leucine-rich PPR motif-containing protein, mitochondrial [Colletes gigas]
MIRISSICTKKLKQFSQSATPTKRKRIDKLIIEFCNYSSLPITRNTPSISNAIENVRVNTKFEEMENCLKTQEWMKKSHIENILEYIYTADNIKSFQALTLLQWCNIAMDCLPAERLKLGISIWNYLSICKFKMSSSHYNTLLQIYIQNDHDFSPMEILKEMNQKKINPNSITYQKCIEYYCMKGHINSALELIKHTEEQKFVLDEAIYNSLINGYSQINDIENATKTLITMKKNKIKASSETYTALINFYARNNNIDKIIEIIDTCKINNIHFSNKNILNVIYVLVVNNHTKDIDKMYQYMNTSTAFSYDEFYFILKLINSNQMDVVLNILPYIKNITIIELILQNMVYSDTTIDHIVHVCTFLENERMYKKPLLQTLYYSYLKDDDHLCLPLLIMCKHRYIIKPHYFWPLLMKKAQIYDLKGILIILESMSKVFNVSPCIDTVTNYVLPFTFGTIPEVRKMLHFYGLNTIIIDNAYVLFLLQRFKLKRAAKYMQYYPNYYSYTTVEHELRQTLIITNDIICFVHISNNLVDDTSTNLMTMYDKKANISAHTVSMEKQLLDFMINYPFYKKLLVKIILYLGDRRVYISQSTATKIYNFLKDYIEVDVRCALENMSNIMRKKQIN